MMHSFTLLFTLSVVCLSAVNCMRDCLEPDTRVIARWKNGNYYKGVVESLTNVIGVLFDNGNRLTYNLHNNYDIIEDRIPDENEIKWGDPVIVNRPHSFAYKPAHIREIVDGRYMIWYDDGSYIYQTKDDIRVFNKSGVCNEPAYLGCYRDQVPRYLTVFIPTRPATVGACVDMCNAQGFSIAALRNSDLCFCGNAYNKGYQTDNKKCDTPCFDNPYEICGGVNTFSQYWSGIVGDSPAHLPGGLTAPTALHMDPYGFKPSYSTAITKQNIPRYGKLPWKSILQARRRSKAPVSLADQSPWKWDLRTSSWVRADGKHFHWSNNKLIQDGMGTSSSQTPAVNKQWTQKLWPSATKPFYAQTLGSVTTSFPVPARGPLITNHGMVQPVIGRTKAPIPVIGRTKAPILGRVFQQHKTWNTPVTSKQTAVKYMNEAFAQAFTPRHVLEKLANRMAHVKWSTLSNFQDAFEAVPPAPKTFRYLGCFADDYQRDLPFSMPVYPLTSRSCILKCRAHKFSVAGIQDSSQCFCGNSYSRYGRVREEECNKNCAVSTRDTCGGVLRNSLYYTGVGSAWPKSTTAPKKSSTIFHSSKPHKADPSRDITVKLPGKLTSVTYIRKPSKKVKSASTVKETKQKAKKKSKLKKLKARNKITTSPASKPSSDLDDFRVESIKVKLNFNELKKALKTMSPSIVRRIQEDLQKINKLESKKEHDKKVNKTGGEPVKTKNANVSTVDYNKEMKRIREKLDKVPINRLTTKNMRDILKIMNIPESTLNVTTNVVHDGKTSTENNSAAVKHGDGDVAHEEIESYSKISLDFPLKPIRRDEEDQESFNKKKQLLDIIAKHISANRKEADKNTSTNQKEASNHKSTNRKAVIRNKPTNHKGAGKNNSSNHNDAGKKISTNQKVGNKNVNTKANHQDTSKHVFGKPRNTDKNSTKKKDYSKKSNHSQQKSDKKLLSLKTTTNTKKPIKAVKLPTKIAKPAVTLGIKKVKQVKTLTKPDKPVSKSAHAISNIQLMAAAQKGKNKAKDSSKSKKRDSKPAKNEKHSEKKGQSENFEDALLASSEKTKNTHSVQKKKAAKHKSTKDKPNKEVKLNGKIKTVSTRLSVVKSKTSSTSKPDNTTKQNKTASSVRKGDETLPLGKADSKGNHMGSKQTKNQNETVNDTIDSTKNKSSVGQKENEEATSKDKTTIKDKTNNTKITVKDEQEVSNVTSSNNTKIVKEDHKVESKNKTSKIETPSNQTVVKNPKDVNGLQPDKEKKTKTARKPDALTDDKKTDDKNDIPAAGDDNGVIYLGDKPDEASAFDEPMMLNAGEIGGEPASGLPGLQNIESNDENKLLSFQNDQTHLNAANLGETGSGIATSDDIPAKVSRKPAPLSADSEEDVSQNKLLSFQNGQTHLNSANLGETGSGIATSDDIPAKVSRKPAPLSADSEGDISHSSPQKAIELPKNITDIDSGDDIPGTVSGNDESNYIYFNNGTIKDVEKLPLIRQDDLKRLLKQREDAMKRSDAPLQEPSTPSQAKQPPKPMIDKQKLYTRSHIPHIKHIKQYTKVKGLRVVKNGVAFTINKKKKLSQKEYLNSLRKKLKGYKKASRHNTVSGHRERLLHHISERTNKKSQNDFKDSKREIEDGEKDTPVEFKDEGAINELISRNY